MSVETLTPPEVEKGTTPDFVIEQVKNGEGTNPDEREYFGQVLATGYEDLSPKEQQDVELAVIKVLNRFEPNDPSRAQLESWLVQLRWGPKTGPEQEKEAA